jgi:predicted DCC family thiol-disulfide oxidoreductase YuxK
MDHLQRTDVHHAIAFENIYADDFTSRFPSIDRQEADRILHGQLADGEVITGLDVTYRAWCLVGPLFLRSAPVPGVRRADLLPYAALSPRHGRSGQARH